MADGGFEAAFQDAVEVPVRALQHLSQDPLDVLGSGGFAELPDQVDVVIAIEGVVHPVGPAVGLQQQPVDLLLGLLHRAAHKGLNPEHALLRDEEAVGLEPAFPGEDDNQVAAGFDVVDVGFI